METHVDRLLDEERSATDTILVVDDSELTLEFCKEVLEEAGYTVLTSVCPFRGFRQIARHQVGLIMLDYNLPGFSPELLATFIKGCRDVHQESKVVLYSGAEIAVLEEATRRTGADGFLCKAGSEGELLHNVRKWLLSAKKRQSTVAFP